jgi:hypothetical protein
MKIIKIGGRSLLVCLLCFLFPALIYANEDEVYKTEVSLSILKSDSSDMTSLGSTFYFSEVNTAGHPYAEADFFERASSLSLLWGKPDSGSDNSLDLEGSLYSIYFKYIVPETSLILQPIYFGSKTKTKIDMTYQIEAKNKIYGLGVGYYLTDNFLLGINYWSGETEYTAFFPIGTTIKQKYYVLTFKYVNELSEKNAVNFQGSINIINNDDGTDKDSNTTVGLSGAYYFTRSFSLGIGVEKNTGDNLYQEGITKSIYCDVYITSFISAKLNFSSFAADNNITEDSEDTTFQLMARF